ncbi:hypothetical protein DIPPA_06131 [Diplonema papillatum]|nr:hypothetical protein DIPPA_06131 [Diplonema papillatum]
MSRQMMRFSAVLATLVAVSGEESVVNKLLEGVVVHIPDVRIASAGVTVSEIEVSGIQVDELSIEATEQHRHWGLAELYLDNWSVTVSLHAKVPALSVNLAVDLNEIGPVTVVLNLSNPDDPLSTHDATVAEVVALNVTIGKYTCKKGLFCTEIMQKAESWWAQPSHQAEVRRMVGDSLTGVLRKLALAEAAGAYPSAASIAHEREKAWAGVDGLFGFEGTRIANVSEFVVNRVYGAKQADGDTALGQLLNQFVPKATVNIGITEPFAPGPGNNITVSNVTLGEYTVPEIMLDFVSDHTVAMSVTVADIKATVSGFIQAQNPTNGYTYAAPVLAAVDDAAFRLNFSIFLAANETQFGQLPLGSLLDPMADALVNAAVSSLFETQRNGKLDPAGKGAYACWFAHPVDLLNVSTLSFEVLAADLTTVTVGGVSAEPILGAAEIAMHFFGNAVNYALHAPVNEALDALDLLIETSLPLAGNGSNPCSEYVTPEPLRPFDYQHSAVIDALGFMINEGIGTKGPWGINGWLEAVAAAAPPMQPKMWEFDDPSMFGKIRVGLRNAYIKNAQGHPVVDKLDLFQPANQTLLRNVLGVGGLTMGADVYFFIASPSEDPFSNNFTAAFTIRDVSAVLDILAAFDPTLLLTTPLAGLLVPGCLFGTLDTFSIPRAMLTLLESDSFETTVDCHHCESPGFNQLNGTLNSGKGSKQLNAAVQDGFDQINDMLSSSFAQQKFVQSVANAKNQCETGDTPPPAYHKDVPGGPMTNEIVFSVIYSTVGLYALGLAVHASRALCQWRKEFPSPRPSEQPLLFHPSINVYVRYGIVFLILLCTAFFLTANLLLGASVHAVVTMGGSKINFDNLFTYALGNTCRDMWNGKVYLISAVIALFSGIWPYIKLSTLLWSWVMPPCRLVPDRRETVLQVLDYTGKWSLMDTMMTIMLMIAFRMHIYEPGLAFLPDNFLMLDVIVTPGWGVYGFMTGAILSLTINHVMVIMHRNAVEYNDTNGASSSWFNHVDPGRAEERIVLASHGWQGVGPAESKLRTAGVLFLLAASLILLVLGATVDTFEFEFQGLVAWLINEDEAGSQSQSYSLISLSTRVTKQADVQESVFGLWYIAIGFILFTFITPLVQFVMLHVLWLVPLTLREQKLLLFANEIIAAWCALEVFIFVLISVLLQIGKFASFLVGDSCDYIDFIMSSYLQPMGYFKHYDATCFSTKAVLLRGCWILFAATFLSNAAYLISWRAAAILIRHRHSDHEASSPLVSKKTPATTAFINESDDDDTLPAGPAEP